MRGIISRIKSLKERLPIWETPPEIVVRFVKADGTPAEGCEDIIIKPLPVKRKKRKGGLL